MNLRAGVLRGVRSAAALAIGAAAAGGLAAGPALASTARVIRPVTVASVARPVAATGFGWLRLAHFSPNTPAVDVYLYSVGKPGAVIVLRHVAYGEESPYEQVRAGEYTVAMRAAGAAPTTKPVLSTLVDVAAGGAYTVAGMGPFKALRLAVLQDQLITPPGRALVRVIEASLQQKRVTVRLGSQSIATGLEFGSATSYVSVPPGTSTLHVAGGSQDASTQVSLAAGSIRTFVVLDDPGHLAIQVLVDAIGSSAVPAGPADTGFGGTAARAGPPLLPWLAAAVLGLIMAAAGGVRLRARRPGAHARG
jgi:Domain of unknown function (DUF4397)